MTAEMRRPGIENANRGGQGRNRTTDTRIFSPLLYRLSYLAPSQIKALQRLIGTILLHIRGHMQQGNREVYKISHFFRRAAESIAG